MAWIWGLISLLAAALVCAGIKIWSLRRAARDLRQEFSERLSEDTNVGLTVNCGDKEMRELAADLDRQLKLLREKQLQYELGDMEIKTAMTDISHDLRTPLTAISGYMQLLKKEEVSVQVREYLDIIENRAEAMKKLTEELFQYSVAVSAEQYRQKENILLNEALEESLAAMYGALTQKRIRVRTEFPREKIYVEANRSALLRIFENVINNALKYSRGDLLVRLEDEGNVCFSNYAPALDEVEAGKLFQRFYTVQSGRESTGLGLSIARALAEQMGGKISAEKEEEYFTVKIFLKRRDTYDRNHFP